MRLARRLDRSRRLPGSLALQELMPVLGTQWVTGDGVDTRVSYAVLANSSRRAPIAQSAEAADLKSVQCRFESDWGDSLFLF